MRIAFLLAVLVLSGCDCSGPTPTGCTSGADCAAGMICRDAQCVAAPDGGSMDGAVDPEADGSICVAGERVCGSDCCGAGEVCGTDGQCCVRDVLCGS
jgi:hypothetical protein